ncbi:MAG: site-specific DNA-methyltransferase [Promethearchaeota archaeon]|nr:MAG: site-specific DNA-methyltransferase [Candidatus Lokiarchaeota archaeon]
MVLPNLVHIEDVSNFSFSARFSQPVEPETKIFSEKGTYHPRNSLNHLTGKEWIQFSRSWFVHKPKPRDKKKGEDLHPAKYPEDLISRFIEFFTKKGAWVLDPFSGTASTLVAAESVERNAIGFEISEKWAKIGAKRTNQYVILGNVQQISSISHLPKFDFCISSPPYWDMLGHSRGGSESTQKDRIKKGYDATFSSLEDDLGNIIKYDKFMETLLLIYDNIRLKMKQGAYCVVIMQNTLKAKQEFYPLAWEFALKMRDHGWNLRQEFIWCQSDKKLGIWGYPNTYISNVHHHYCLVFQIP